jgi:predicted nuclease of predicted toxin-antitoxin system
MKVKLDENLGNICNQEQRCIVSLDLDFSNVLVYKQPSKYTGIAVIRLPKNSGTDVLYEMVETLAQKMKEVNIQGKLWIVQKNGIREYQEDF